MHSIQWLDKLPEQKTARAIGQEPGDLLRDIAADYLEERAQVQNMLDSRYDDIRSGRVKPCRRRGVFESLRRREEAC